jgi:hypothetical protein
MNHQTMRRCLSTATTGFSVAMAMLVMGDAS